MTKYIVQGGSPLFGEVHISGAKNAAVAILPAALLVDGVCRIENIPQISDVTVLLKILEQLGAKVRVLNRSDVELDCRHIVTTRAPQELAQSGQLANFSFGQGSLLAAPMQVAALFNTLAADGVYRAPYVLQATLDETTGQPVETLSHPRGRRVIPTQSAALLRAMLVQVVQQGTAQDAAGLSGGAGGKTGTAQTGQFTPEGTERCNLWFAGFWPAEKPRYTIVVLQDGAIHTAYSGAAIFAQVCNALEAAG